MKHKIINKMKLYLIFLLFGLLVVGVTTAGASLEEKDEEFVELMNYVDQYFEQGSETDLESYLTDYNAEIVGFTNLKKGPIAPQELAENYLAGDSVLLYIVKKGDSLYRIANKFAVNISELESENNLTSDMLEIGQKLYIPVSNLEKIELPERKNKLVYTVERKDSLYTISRETGVSINAIREENNLDSDILQVGQKLDITLKKDEKEQIYVVRAGDSLYKIARKLGTTVEIIRQNNDLTEGYIYPGQKLSIPKDNKEDDYKGNQADFTIPYVTQPRETVNSIARNFSLDARDIRKINNLSNNYLDSYQEIMLPFSISDEIRDLEIPVSEQELDLLAHTVYSEARGEPFKGQVAVAAVVLNRVLNEYFPNNIEEVIFQPWQFSSVHDGQFWLEPNQQSYVAVKAALEGWDPTKRAIYFYNPQTSESEWVFYRNIVIKIGQHYFAV
ncbi:MAG: LysM peptidoglycan-binding domain-containing protein [bacterium]